MFCFSVFKVEDIVDTGNTVSCLIEHMTLKKASSVSVCTFLDKPSRRKVYFKLVGDGKFYSGFEVSCFYSGTNTIYFSWDCVEHVLRLLNICSVQMSLLWAMAWTLQSSTATYLTLAY